MLSNETAEKLQVELLECKMKLNLETDAHMVCIFITFKDYCRILYLKERIHAHLYLLL